MDIPDRIADTLDQSPTPAPRLVQGQLQFDRPQNAAEREKQERAYFLRVVWPEISGGDDA